MRRIPISGSLGFVLRIAVLFLVAGPPIGALAFGLLGATAAWLSGQPAGTAGMVFYGGIFAVFISWAIGGLQAAAAGLIVAAAALAARRYSLRLAAGAGLATGLAYVLIHLADEGSGVAFGALVLSVHIVAAVICTILARTLFPISGQAAASGGAE